MLCQGCVPKLLDGSVFTNAARVIGVVIDADLECMEEDDVEGGDRVSDGERGRWYPVFIAALTIKSLRHVRCGSSGAVDGEEVGFGVGEFMIVEFEDDVVRLFWDSPLNMLDPEPEDHCAA